MAAVPVSELAVGLAVTRLGRSSVTYRLGVFKEVDRDPQPVAALGHWVHVYVDRASNRPVPLPAPLRAALTPLLRAPAAKG